ncbi:hypothetical protein ACIBCO_38580 [Streptomyces violascens]|uniref:hypothetical protein n=1 Tax=Streptomyces violascens TaxID=67381 RepID=UPI00379572B2
MPQKFLRARTVLDRGQQDVGLLIDVFANRLQVVVVGATPAFFGRLVPAAC